MDKDHDVGPAEAAVAGEADEPRHALAGIDGVERQALEARGETDRLLSRGVGEAVGAGAEARGDLDLGVVPALSDAEQRRGLRPTRRTSALTRSGSASTSMPITFAV